MPVREAVRCALDCANVLGEGPLWCPETRMLWWLDIGAPALWRMRVDDGFVEQRPLPGPAGSFAFFDDGRLLIALRRGVALLDRFDGTPEPLSVDGLALGDDRFNDGKCDRAGRFWAGTMDRQMSAPIGALYRFDRPDRCVRMDAGFALSNGIGWSPDDRTMYFAETTSGRIHAYDYDLARGAVERRRVLVESAPGAGRPDGLTVDAEGGIWSARFGAACLHRYDPSGRLERVVPLPVSQPTSVTFGGDRLDRLYVTSARVNLAPAALAAEPLAGALLVVDAGVRGVPEPRMRSGARGPSGGGAAHGR